MDNIRHRAKLTNKDVFIRVAFDFKLALMFRQEQEYDILQRQYNMCSHAHVKINSSPCCMSYNYAVWISIDYLMILSFEIDSEGK